MVDWHDGEPRTQKNVGHRWPKGWMEMEVWVCQGSATVGFDGR